MNSRIYNGKVMHARRTPFEHQFSYPYCFYAIDLDELETLQQTVKGFGHNRWRPVALMDSDYLNESGTIREQLAAYTEVNDGDRIILITVARFLANVFRPVSFYYVLTENGSPKAMIAEVNNTFGERHLYAMKTEGSFPLQCSHAKAFHVSPFNNMEGHYEFIFSEPGDDINIDIKLIREGEVVLDASMWGKGLPLNSRNLWSIIAKHPFNAAATMPRILWQAGKLYFHKRLRVYKKPAPSSPMTIKA
jgi:cyclopropane-fatty-acyl-phospholipid synthase